MAGYALGVLLLFGLALELRARWEDRRRRRSLGPIETTEGHAETVRYWFPTYGEVSHLSADLKLNDARHVLPASFGDHVVEGPVRVFAQRLFDERRPSFVTRGLELLPGSRLYRRAPMRPPPDNFLVILSADEYEEQEDEPS